MLVSASRFFEGGTYGPYLPSLSFMPFGLGPGVSAFLKLKDRGGDLLSPTHPYPLPLFAHLIPKSLPLLLSQEVEEPQCVLLSGSKHGPGVLPH